MIIISSIIITQYSFNTYFLVHHIIIIMINFIITNYLFNLNNLIIHDFYFQVLIFKYLLKFKAFFIIFKFLLFSDYFHLKIINFYFSIHYFPSVMFQYPK